MAAIEFLSQFIREKFPLLFPPVAALLTIAIIQAVLSRNRNANIPVIGQELGSEEKQRQAFLLKANELYRAGYDKVSQ